MAHQARVGGSFAPPLTDDLLAKYKALIAGMKPSPAQDALVKLHLCCEKWWNLPESQGAKTTHMSGAAMRPLDKAIQDTLWESIPWAEELEAMKTLFEPLRSDLRNCAYHLLWHAIELEHDREPMTNDKLQV